MAVLVVLLASWVLGNLIYLFPHVLGTEQSHGFEEGGREVTGTYSGGLYRGEIVVIILIVMVALVSLLYMHGQKDGAGLVGVMFGAAALSVFYKFALVHYMGIFMGLLIGGAVVGFLFTGKEYWKSSIVAQTLAISAFIFLLLAAPYILPMLPNSGGEVNLQPLEYPLEGLKAVDTATGGNTGLAVLGIIGIAFMSIAGYNLLGRFIDLRGGEEEEDIKEDISDTVDEAIKDLYKGKDVRSTVLRCYQKMCYVLETGGVQLEDSMTPREFKLEATKRLDVSTDVISDLTQLFEEGRYSSHKLGREQRKQALSNLKALREEMGM